MTLTIVLPLPHKLLSPNARPHWRAKAAVTSKARKDAYLAALDAMNRAGMIRKPRWSEATMQTTFFHRDRRRRDRDNALASCKPVFDGLADAGIVENDSGVTHLPVVFLTDRENPRVEIRVSDVTPVAAGNQV